MPIPQNQQNHPANMQRQNLAPARVPTPGKILSRELEARGWTQKDLA